MAYARRRMFRLDQLVIGARPDRLKAQSEIPVAAVPGKLSAQERARLSTLRMKSATERLSPEEFYEFTRLKGRL